MSNDTQTFPNFGILTESQIDMIPFMSLAGNLEGDDSHIYSTACEGAAKWTQVLLLVLSPASDPACSWALVSVGVAFWGYQNPVRLGSIQGSMGASIRCGFLFARETRWTPLKYIRDYKIRCHQRLTFPSCHFCNLTTMVYRSIVKNKNTIWRGIRVHPWKLAG